MTPQEKARLDRITEPGILLWKRDGAFINELVAGLEAKVQVLQGELVTAHERVREAIGVLERPWVEDPNG